MMKRRSVLKLMAAPAVLTLARPGSASAKEKVTYAYLLDPAYDAVTWAMSNGKVASDLIEVEARGLAIPQLIQATSAKQYDVVMTAVIAIPPAKARGLVLAGGQGKLKGRIFRLGHLGSVTTDEVLAAIAVIEAVAIEHGLAVEPGAAVAAAQRAVVTRAGVAVPA